MRAEWEKETPPMVTDISSFFSNIFTAQADTHNLHLSQKLSSSGTGSVGSSSAVVTTEPRMTAAPWAFVMTLPERPNQPTPERTAR